MTASHRPLSAQRRRPLRPASGGPDAETSRKPNPRQPARDRHSTPQRDTATAPGKPPRQDGTASPGADRSATRQQATRSSASGRAPRASDRAVVHRTDAGLSLRADSTGTHIKLTRAVEKPPLVRLDRGRSVVAGMTALPRRPRSERLRHTLARACCGRREGARAEAPASRQRSCLAHRFDHRLTAGLDDEQQSARGIPHAGGTIASGGSSSASEDGRVLR